MLLDFGYLHNFFMFYFLFLEKAENDRLKKNSCQIYFIAFA